MRSGNPNPPKTASRFLEWFCPPGLYEGIMGDLSEQFYKNVEKSGFRKAKWKFTLQVFRFFRPGIILRNHYNHNIVSIMLFVSYLKIAWRNLLKNKTYSAINIFGLSIGIATCLLTFSYINFELSFDNFHPDVDRTFRVNETMIWTTEGGLFGSTGPALAPALLEHYPDIEEALRINTMGNYVIRHEDAQGRIIAHNEDNVLAADSDFFDFFGFRLKEGNPAEALKGINKVVISDEAEKRFFGDQKALGKILLLGQARTPLLVTGVTYHQPDNAHFHFDYLLSIDTNPDVKNFEWSYIWSNIVTYVKLKPGADKKALEAKLYDFGEKYVKPSLDSRGFDYEQLVKGKGGWHFYLQPVRDIHLYSTDIGNRLGPVGDITYVIIFGIIGIFVLVIAAINFINLSTARASKRAREVGVKKALGAFRNSLVVQFQVESILVTTLSTILALFMAGYLGNFLSRTTGIYIPLKTIFTSRHIWIIPLIPLVIGFLAGLYPSFYLTSFRPVQVLKGKLSAGIGNSSLRNVLVTVQFIISVILIAGTIVVFRQLNFLDSKNLGFNKENILVIQHAERLQDHIEAFRDELRKIPGVRDAAIGMDVPGGGQYQDIWKMSGSDIKISLSALKVDEHYFNLLGLKLVTGRYFTDNDAADKYRIILNETAVRQFGLTPDNAIGKYVVYTSDSHHGYEIIGVVKDYNYSSLYEPVQPLALIGTQSNIWGDQRVIALKFQTDDIPKLISRIEDRWKSTADATPFQFNFLDQQLANQYDQEKKLGYQMGLLSSLSVIVALIGLIGLVSYSVEIRKKEIGIRKVFGASSTRIVIMLNNQYLKLVLISLAIAVPVSWWAFQKWLESFAYRIHINGFIFLLTALIELSVTILCVGYISIRAARLNPAYTLKDE